MLRSSGATRQRLVAGFLGSEPRTAALTTRAWARPTPPTSLRATPAVGTSVPGLTGRITSQHRWLTSGANPPPPPGDDGGKDDGPKKPSKPSGFKVVSTSDPNSLRQLGANKILESLNETAFQVATRSVKYPATVPLLVLDSKPLMPHIGMIITGGPQDMPLLNTLIRLVSSQNPFVATFLRKQAPNAAGQTPANKLVAQEFYETGILGEVLHVHFFNQYGRKTTISSSTLTGNGSNSGSKALTTSGGGKNPVFSPEAEQSLVPDSHYGWHAIIRGVERVKKSPLATEGEASALESDPPMLTIVKRVDADPTAGLSEVEAEPINATLRAAYEELSEAIRPVLPAGVRASIDSDTGRSDVITFADICASLTQASGEELQRILDTESVQERIFQTTLLLRKEAMYMTKRQEYHRDLEQNLSDYTRRHFLQDVIKRSTRELQEMSNNANNGQGNAMGGGPFRGGAGASGAGPGDEKTAVYRNRLARFNHPSSPTGKSATKSAGAAAEGANSASQETTSTPTSTNTIENDDEFWERQLALGGSPLTMPANVRAVIEEELTRLEPMEKHNAEYHMVKQFLDWLTLVPWGRTTHDVLDVEGTKRVLDEDHYGLEEVKKRILEFVAVSKLRGSVQGKIVCLVGPPGVGKTSVAESIAKALGRKFYRLSLGGMWDVTEIKGHRRTYVASMPGKLVQIFKQAGCVNPLILLDEIDKLGNRGGSQHGGDPSGALLELLDPSQNKGFLDNYLDLPVDASKCLFLLTANTLSTIPRPLLDRLEIIQVPSYVAKEKVEIAKRHLEPKAREASGLLNAKVPVPRLSQEAFEALTQWYCREGGVRNLQKHIEMVYRKMALEILERSSAVVDGAAPEATEEREISAKELEKYVGKRKYQKERLFGDGVADPGIVMGLGWTEDGGTPLYLETTAIPAYFAPASTDDGKKEPSLEDRGTFDSTGRLGETMLESKSLAYINAKRFLKQLGVGDRFLQTHKVHLHVPEGSIPKDGPSAGVTITTALISLATNTPVDTFLAMTGEISLTGLVLPVGGIREKVAAARRAGVTTVLLPAGNSGDYDELPAHLKEGLTVHFCQHYQDVAAVVFPDLIARAAGSASTTSSAAATSVTPSMVA